MGHSTFQEPPQMLGHKLISPLWEMESIREIERVVLQSREQPYRHKSWPDGLKNTPDAPILISISCRKELKVLLFTCACNVKSQELDWVKNELELTHSFPLQAAIYLLTWPSFCISDQRSSTSVPHWAAACTHAWAYCPATEFSRLREHPERDRENHPDAWKPGMWMGYNFGEE